MKSFFVIKCRGEACFARVRHARACHVRTSSTRCAPKWTWQAVSLRLVLVFLAIFTGEKSSRAQVATSFYNVTDVETTNLPNAVRVAIKADGAIYFGGVQTDFINWNNTYEPKPTTSIRLRVLGARSKLPAFVNINQYPFDSLAVSVAPADFPDAYFRWEAPNWEPHVDITVRFFTPVKIQRFQTSFSDYGIRFGQTLDANELNIELGQDGSSIVMTVVPDRVDARAVKNIVRSPSKDWKRFLRVTSSTQSGRADIHALHTPLLEVLGEASRVFKTSLLAATDAGETDISLSLPNADQDTFLRALENGYGLVAVARDDGGWTFTRATYAASNNTSSTRSGDELKNEIPLSGKNPLQRVTLNNLSPDVARTLLPDFLLPTLRVDRENNALLFSASAELAAKIRADLAKLDTPRTQVRVEAQAWEIATTEEANRALQATYVGENARATIDTQSGQIGVRLSEQGQRGLLASLQLLEWQGRAKLSAKPFVVVLSGQRGSLFLGQNRFVPVLEENGNARALNLQIGTTLNVTPRVGLGREITLDLNPRFSTIDSIESGSRLPTLGIREANATVRVLDGDTILVAGLDADLRFGARSRSFLPANRRKDDTKTALIILVTAKKVNEPGK